MSLRPYQQSAVLKLAAHRRYILGDEVGLGKTRTGLAAARAVGFPTRVICPAAVTKHWLREAERIGWPADLPLDVLSYGKLVADPTRAQLPGTPITLILDEFHYCKHEDSQRSELIFGSTGLARQVLATGGNVWPVSGTPMPRHPGELYPVSRALWRDDLKKMGIESYMDWLTKFTHFKVGPHGPKVLSIRVENLNLLRGFLGPRMVRRRLQDVRDDLPEVRFGVITIEAEDLSTLPTLPESTRAVLAAGRLPVMDPMLAKYMHAVGDLKAHSAVEMLSDELREDTARKIVVLAHHKSVIARLRNDLAPWQPLVIDGSVPAAKREELIALFRLPTSSHRVVIGQTAAMGTGTDGLQYAAHEMVVVEPEWDSGLGFVQAIGRLRRVGQTFPVNVRWLSLADTPDEAVIRQTERETAMRMALDE